MKGLKAAAMDANNIQIRLAKMYRLGRLAREDFDRLHQKVDELRRDLEATREILVLPGSNGE